MHAQFDWKTETPIRSRATKEDYQNKLSYVLKDLILGRNL